MRKYRAARTAPAIAANSRPPKQRKTCTAFVMVSRLMRTPSRTTSAFLARPSPETPVPGPVHSSAMPPNKPWPSAAAAVVLAIPISPRHNTSQPGVTAFMPIENAWRNSGSSIAGSWVKSQVGLSSESSNTRSSASIARAN